MAVLGHLLGTLHFIASASSSNMYYPRPSSPWIVLNRPWRRSNRPRSSSNRTKYSHTHYLDCVLVLKQTEAFIKQAMTLHRPPGIIHMKSEWIYIHTQTDRKTEDRQTDRQIDMDRHG